MNSFDERAKDWDDNPNRRNLALATASAIREKLIQKPGMAALEYGCGTGMLGFALHENFASITLADSSQGMLDVLSEKIKAAGLPHMKPIRLDLSSDPLPSKRYDVILSQMALHHIPDTSTIISKLHALLKPGGELFLADLDEEDGSFHGPDADVHKGFNRDALKAMLERTGFKNVSFSTVFQVRRPVGDAERDFPVFLASAGK